MGWTCFYVGTADEKREIERLVTFENDERAMRPICTVKNGSVWYLAVEVTNKTATDNGDYEVDQFGRYVFAAVILTSRSGGEWCYKDMEEGMGPCEATAPKKLLDLLSPTTKEYALNWRKRCLESATLKSRKVAHGDTIKLGQPLTFDDGVELDTFIVQKQRFLGRKTVTTFFKCTATGVNVRISKFMQRAWVKV